jgi:hypothetical protein
MFLFSVASPARADVPF